jgi:gluconate 2-dehydrogenase subunit 3-like protein
MRRGYSRREVLSAAAKLGAAGAVAKALPLGSGVSRAVTPGGALAAPQRRTLDAALARMIPADGPDDWSAADIGVGDYIERLLSGDGRIYAGGPTRRRFAAFRRLTRAKEIGWEAEIRRLRSVYSDGLAELDRRAGGSFADAPEPAQDLVLTTLDLEGSPFFAALYAHTMEGAYSHPVYGGNKDYRAWQDLCYQGDVHGVRFPTKGSTGSWNDYGGYAPEEMAAPGECPGQGPTT